MQGAHGGPHRSSFKQETYGSFPKVAQPAHPSGH